MQQSLRQTGQYKCNNLQDIQDDTNATIPKINRIYV